MTAAAPEDRLPERLPVTERDWDLIEVALESAAMAVQSGATLTGRGVDPLAREYLSAQRNVQRLRRGVRL